ncbi:hypothetical protein [uncultured Treponema sp.]|uniref:hypothetical protein n=1 Tax=uncultured Treponema sp. TaxID=162155 RepID=UPI0025F84233|nr:hypothetical protein [uncultured Treponema sp.]
MEIKKHFLLKNKLSHLNLTVLKTLILLLLFACAIPLFAEEGTFYQKIEWKSNANALEYKVEIQSLADGKSQFITTDKTSTEISLPPAKYRYRVFSYDFLGKEAGVSAWTNFEVYKANKPKINYIEDNVKVPKDGGAVALDVKIDDVNSNSKFELVSESLQGTIRAGDRVKMKKSASETDSVTHLDFKNVPPGKWRLRVTNVSGYSSLSDVITVEGEKTYTAAEVELIKKTAVEEREELVRKEFSDKMDEYIRVAEEERAREVERIVREKEEAEKAKLAEEARILAEKEAAEKARLAEEERAKAEREKAEIARIERERRLAEERAEAEKRREEERIAREKEAAEKARLEELARIAAEKKAKAEAKKRAKEERKKRPYIWKNVSFEGGLGYALNLYDGTIKENYDKSMTPALNFRAKALPYGKTDSNRFGFELNFLGLEFEKENNFYSADLKSAIFDVKFLWQHKLVDSLFLCTKAGFGADFIQKTIKYNTSSSLPSRPSPEDKSYTYPALTGGISLFYIPWKCIVFETGIDFSHVVSSSSQLGFLTPFACVGFRF